MIAFDALQAKHTTAGRSAARLGVPSALTNRCLMHICAVLALTECEC